MCNEQKSEGRMGSNKKTAPARAGLRKEESRVIT